MLTQAISFPREEFLEERWAYSPGEHVSFVAPTQTGKTTLAFQLFDHSASPELPAIILVMKPRDKTVKSLIEERHYKVVKDWPPPFAKYRKESGWVVWPKHEFDPQKDTETLRRIFRKAILDSYRRGNRILFADEVYGLAKELKLQEELIAVWQRGASMGCGLWAATQKPAFVPTWMYNQAEHVFLGYDPDRRSRQRFAEIGGIDPDFVESNVFSLKEHEWLYIRRTGPVACIIEA